MYSVVALFPLFHCGAILWESRTIENGNMLYMSTCTKTVHRPYLQLQNGYFVVVVVVVVITKKDELRMKILMMLTNIITIYNIYLTISSPISGVILMLLLRNLRGSDVEAPSDLWIETVDSANFSDNEVVFIVKKCQTH